MNNNINELHTDLLTRQTKEQLPFVIDSWLRLGEMMLLYAERGIGKTYTSLHLAHSIASNQKFLGNLCSRYKVLYIDGEMGASALKRRMDVIDMNPDNDSGWVQNYIHIFTLEDTKYGVMPNLSTEHNFYNDLIEKTECKVIIIDNLNTTAFKRDSRDNEYDIWMRLQTWSVKLRLKGFCIIFIHHTGKSGLQLGTIQKENVVDYMIGLKKTRIKPYSNSYSPFEFVVEKKRDLPPDVLNDLFVQFTIDKESQVFKIMHEDLYYKKKQECKKLYEVGNLKVTEIAQKLKLEGFEVQEFINDIF
jgi:KaiC/GvpD/RAD55 family RecA-like ATPase